jgi:hypothetical protein
MVFWRRISATISLEALIAITSSYSLTMIPEWEKALETATTLMSADGRLVVPDLDAYTEQG